MLYIVILPIIALLTLTALAVHSVIEKPYEIFKRSSSASTGSFTMPEGTTYIGYNAFYGYKDLTSITIPASATSIGEAEFMSCSSLTSITIPEGVTSIGHRAFYGCSRLTSIAIPEGATSIGDNAFYVCSSLASITIPASVTSIGRCAFYGCSSLTSITIPEGVTSIGTGAFYGCSSLTSITIPEGVTSIGHSAFNRCSSLTSITIPASVTSIGPSAFSGCSSLASITIPEGVTSIGAWAFRCCSSLAFIVIPEHFANKDDDFWKMLGINREKTKLITQTELDTFKNKLEGSYKDAELATLYSITEDNNYQPTWRALSSRSPLGNILVHDVLMATPASKTSCLPDIIFEHQRIRLGRDNISILLGALGKLARGGYDHVLNFLTVKDLAKISMAKLTVKSTALSTPTDKNVGFTHPVEQQDNKKCICTIS